MTNKELQEFLAKFPDNMPVRLLPKIDPPRSGYENRDIIDLTEENILQTSEGAWIDDEAPSDTWDHEDGKIRHKGKRYLLFNPIIT